MLSQDNNINESEYLNIVSSLSGLSPKVVIEYFRNNNKKLIKYMIYVYNKKPEYKTEYVFYPFTAAEKTIKRKTPLPDLKVGDILITLNTYTFDWRHGHCAIVINDVQMKTLEHTSIGSTSLINDAYEWGRYPSFAVLRYPDSNIAKKAAEYAKQQLCGVKYSIFAGIIGEKNNNSKSNCSHLVWLAYKYAGVDIDNNGGKIVTPENILSCTSLKVVQLFGMDPSKFQTRWLM